VESGSRRLARGFFSASRGVAVYNPFEAPLMEKVTARIVVSIQRTLRKLFLVFYNTDSHPRVFEQFFALSRFHREDVADLPRDPTNRYRRDLPAAIFESLP